MNPQWYMTGCWRAFNEHRNLFVEPLLFKMAQMDSLLYLFLNSLLSASIDIPNRNNARAFTGLEIIELFMVGQGSLMQLGSLRMCDGVALHEVDWQAASFYLLLDLFSAIFGAIVHQSIFPIQHNILFHPFHLSGGFYL